MTVTPDPRAHLHGLEPRDIDRTPATPATPDGAGTDPAWTLPLIPPVRWVCCHCGGTGLASDGDTCPHCHGHGHC